MKKAICLAFAAAILTGWCSGQEMMRREMPTGILPPEVLRPVIDKAKSKEGRYVLLSSKQRVLVIDVPDHWFAVEEAIMKIDPSKLDVALDFAFRTVVPPVTAVTVPASPFADQPGDFPVPTGYSPPRVILHGNGQYTVVPATPTAFTRRNIGISMEADPFAVTKRITSAAGSPHEPDFEGYIANGSGTFTGGKTGVQPVLEQVAQPGFFADVLKEAGVAAPVTGATVIASQILVKPTISPTGVVLELTPQLVIDGKRKVTLNEYRTTARLDGSQPASVEGFTGAPAEFNHHFLDEKGEAGGTLINISGRVKVSS